MRKRPCALEAPVATNDDQTLDAEILERLHCFFLALVRQHFKAAGTLQNGSALIGDIFNLLRQQFC